MSALENAEVAVQPNGAAKEDAQKDAQRQRIAVENPATGETVGYVDDMDAATVAAIVDRARAAQPDWEALGFEGRAAKLRDLRVWMVENRKRVIDMLVTEGGKTPEDAMLADLWYVCDALGFWGKKAKKYLADERVKTHSPLLLGKRVIVRYRPLGVVGVIGPWNYPLTNTFGDVIPALMAGNSVVMKPSEVTPLTSLLVAEGAAAVGLPEGVLSVATGTGETGAALIDNVDMIMFTGSTRTGKKVMARAAERLIPVSLELGGKDPMIVLGDADLERAANMAVQWAMSNSGQICMAVERVYVEEPVYDEFVASVVEKVGTPPTGRARRARHGGRGRDDVSAADGDHRSPRARRDRQGRGGARRRQAGSRPGPLLRADRADGRGSHDGGDARRDVRPGATDHEGARCRGGGPARQRHALRPELERLHEGSREGRANRPPPRGRQRMRQRRAHELPRAGGAVRRHGRVGPRCPARAAGDPEVLLPSRRSW